MSVGPHRHISSLAHQNHPRGLFLFGNDGVQGNMYLHWTGQELAAFVPFINDMHICHLLIISPTSTNLTVGGVYWFHLVRPSICLSFHLWTESCLLCIFNKTCWIHIIFTHVIKLFQKVCHMLIDLQNSKPWIFGIFLKICNFHLVLFGLEWKGSNMIQ